MMSLFTNGKGRGFCLWGMAAVAVIAAVVLYGFAAWFGAVNQDEGWYLYAARLVGEGKMPYRDFFFTQGPALPYFYSLFSGLWSSHGLLGGRIFTAALGLVGAFCAAGLARRAASSERAAEAGLIAFALTACNLYHVYFTTLPKTYALASVALLAGYWLLALIVPRQGKRSFLLTMLAVPAGMLIAFAAGARLSLGLLLPVTALALLVTFRKTGSAFFWFSVGGAMGLALMYGPVMLAAPEPFVFSQTFHVSRGGRDYFLMAGSLARIVRGYLPLALLAGAVILMRGRGRCGQEQEGPQSYAGAFWPWIWVAGAAAVFALHLTSPHPYDDYQVPIMPLFVAAFAGWLANGVRSDSVRIRLCAFFGAAALLSSFGSPLAQEWFVARLDRFWIIKKPVSDLAQIQNAAREIRALSGKDDTLLTQDLYLAVEAGMKVPSGLEMGPFSYFPGLSDKEAALYHVMNRKAFLSLLASAPCQVAAYSGYGWAIRSPVMDEVPEADRQRFVNILASHYDAVRETPDFGQNKTTLLVLSRRKQVGE